MRLPVHERYREDPQFQMLVDMIRGCLHQNPETTPTELREAVMLAASMHEMDHIRPLLISARDAEMIRALQDVWLRPGDSQ